MIHNGKKGACVFKYVHEYTEPVVSFPDQSDNIFLLVGLISSSTFPFFSIPNSKTIDCEYLILDSNGFSTDAVGKIIFIFILYIM